MDKETCKDKIGNMFVFINEGVRVVERSIDNSVTTAWYKSRGYLTNGRAAIANLWRHDDNDIVVCTNDFCGIVEEYLFNLVCREGTSSEHQMFFTGRINKTRNGLALSQLKTCMLEWR